MWPNQHFDVNLISRKPSSVNRQLTPATPFLWCLYSNGSKTIEYYIYFFSFVLSTIQDIVKRHVLDKNGVISFRPYFEIIKTKFAVVANRIIFIIHLICFSYFEKKELFFFFFLICIISHPLLSVILAFSRNSNAFSLQSLICS